MTTKFEHWWDKGVRCWVIKITRRLDNPPFRISHIYLKPEQLKSLGEEIVEMLKEEANADPILWKRKSSPTAM